MMKLLYRVQMHMYNVYQVKKRQKYDRKKHKTDNYILCTHKFSLLHRHVHANNAVGVTKINCHAPHIFLHLCAKHAATCAIWMLNPGKNTAHKKVECVTAYTVVFYIRRNTCSDISIIIRKVSEPAHTYCNNN